MSREGLKKRGLRHWVRLYCFGLYQFAFSAIARFPSHSVRKSLLRMAGSRIGKNVGVYGGF